MFRTRIRHCYNVSCKSYTSLSVATRASFEQIFTVTYSGNFFSAPALADYTTHLENTVLAQASTRLKTNSNTQACNVNTLDIAVTLDPSVPTNPSSVDGGNDVSVLLSLSFCFATKGCLFGILSYTVQCTSRMLEKCPTSFCECKLML